MKHLIARIASVLVVAASVVASRTHADESAQPPVQKEATATGEPQRAIYFSKNAFVASLVDLLEQHVEGDAGVKFVAEPNANLLSIRANSAAGWVALLAT